MSDGTVRVTVLLRASTRRPAVITAVLFALGILLHNQVPPMAGGELIVCGFFALAASFTVGRRFVCSGSLLLLVICLGILTAQREHFKFPRDEIGLFAADEPHLTELEVQVVDDPQIVVGSPGAPRSMPPRQLITADVLYVKTLNGWLPATGRIPIQIDQPYPGLQAGQTVRLLGMLQRPRPAMNPGEFDWATYYRQERVLASFTVNRIGNVHIQDDRGAGTLTWLRIKTHHLLASGFQTSHAVDYAILDALVLGNRDPELRDIQDEFKKTGTAYQLSVSGLHIAILGGAVFGCCRLCRIRPRITFAITAGFVLLYSIVALPSHSGIRGSIICAVVVISVISMRSTAKSQLVALAVLAMLLWHPMDLYSIGFQLSFAVAIAFLTLSPTLQAWFKQFRDPDELANLQAGKLYLRQRVWSQIKWCLQAGLIAWLAVLPLAVYYFGQVSGWSILGGLLLLVPIVIALFGGVIKILCTLLWPRASVVWATIAGCPVIATRWGVHWLAKLPGSSIALPTPPIWLIVAYYLLLCAPLLPYWSWTTGKRRWLFRLAPALGLLAIFSQTLWRPTSPNSADELTMTLLSVGAGQCAVVQPPGGHAVLIDAGSTTVSDVAVKVLEPFLHYEGQSQVDDIFLSHGDFDHISAAGEIAMSFAVKQVFTSFHFVPNAAGNEPDLQLLDTLQRLHLSPNQIALGDHFDLHNGVTLDVLWPPATGELNSNNAGLVLRLSYAGRSILFPADIQDPAFAGVLKNAKALKCDILVAPHHGSSEELTPQFLSAVHPEMILSSNAARLSGKQKRFETMTNHIPLYRTPECGAITVTIKKDGTIAVGTFIGGAQPKK